MNRQLHRVSTMALAAAIAILVGCGSTPQQPTVTLPDPQTVPREQWSDALTVLDAMGIHGQRDIPKEMLGRTNGQDVAGSNVNSGVGDIAVGPSVGLGLGLFLLGGGNAQPQGISQVAAWVPADLAASPEAAIAVAVSEWEKARRAAFKNEPRQLKAVTARYPDGYNPSVAYASVADSMLEKPVQITDGPHQAPNFIHSGLVYGPIFIHTKQIYLDARDNDVNFPTAMAAIAKQLPDWFYLYYPGSKFSKQPLPAAVYSNSGTHYFISK